MKLNFTLYLPGEILSITYSPFTLVAAPKFVPSIITLAPTKGSPVWASLIVPESLPVVPE